MRYLIDTVHTDVNYNVDQYMIFATLCMSFKYVCSRNAQKQIFCQGKFTFSPLCVIWRVDKENIIWHVNTGDAYFKERKFTEFDTMLSVWIKLRPERRNLVVGYIDDIKKYVGINDWVWIIETLRYLIKYILL